MNYFHVQSMPSAFVNLSRWIASQKHIEKNLTVLPIGRTCVYIYIYSHFSLGIQMFKRPLNIIIVCAFNQEFIITVCAFNQEFIITVCAFNQEFIVTVCDFNYEFIITVCAFNQEFIITVWTFNQEFIVTVWTFNQEFLIAVRDAAYVACACVCYSFITKSYNVVCKKNTPQIIFDTYIGRYCIICAHFELHLFKTRVR